MNSNYSLTEAEQSALDSARRLLGSNLAAFLLSGSGETQITHRRAFPARGSSRHSASISYQFELINESEQGLPRERDPMVLAAILDLLWRHQSLQSTVRFHESDLIERLGWPQSPESQSRIKRALERYLLTAFYLIDLDVIEGECVFGRYARFRRLLIGYETTLVGMALKRTGSRGQTQLMFLPEFIEDVMSEGKRFLGVDFQRLQGVRDIPC